MSTFCQAQTDQLTTVRPGRKFRPGRWTAAALLVPMLLALAAVPCPALEKKSKKYSILHLNKEVQRPDTIPKNIIRYLTTTQLDSIKIKDDKIERLQKGIIDHKVKILNTQIKERGILAELEKIDLTLIKQRRNLETLKKKVADSEDLLKIKQDELELVAAEKEALNVHVRKRLASYYRTGPVSLINVIFSAETLPDLLTTQEYFRSLLQYDQQAIRDYIAKIDELQKASEEHVREKNRLLELVAQTEVEQLNLNVSRKNKNALLTRVHTEKSLYQQAAAEIERAANDLAETLRNIKQKASLEAPREPEIPAALDPDAPLPDIRRPEDSDVQAIQPDTGKTVRKKFTALKGKLPPPVRGTVTTLFGKDQANQFGVKTVSKGIDIKTANGAEIKAVYRGRVINSGYLRGYGNMLIIDHGNQYYTLVSRAAEFFKTDGDRVNQGDVLGIMGDDETLMGEGLHFEIRHGANPQDPLAWLSRTGLSFQ